MKKLLLMAPLILAGQSALALDLPSAVEQALQHDAGFQKARYDYAAALESLPQAQSVFKPSANLDLSASLSSSNSDLGTWTQPNSASLSVSQKIYSPTDDLNVEQAKQGIFQSEIILDQSKQALILAVSRAYFAVLQARDQLALNEAEVESIERQLEVAQARYEVGLAAVTDFKEAQAQRDQAIARRVVTQTSVETSRAALASLTGDLDTHIAGFPNDFDLPPLSGTLDDWLVRAAQRHDARNANIAKLRADLNIDAAGYVTRPSVSVNGNLSHSFADVFDNPQTSARASVNVTWPLLTGGRAESALRQAYAQRDASAASQTQVVRDAEQQIRQAYLTAASDESQLQALNQALASTQVAREATQAGYEVGTRTAVEVLTALRAEFSAKTNLNLARYNALLNRLILEQAAGTLGQEDIQLGLLSE